MVDSARTGQSDGANAPTRAGGEVEVWSTDAVPLRERFSYWREVVCTAARGFFGTPTEAPPGTFSARVAIRICGSFRIMTVESKTGFQFARTRRDMANTPPNHYGFYLQLNGGMSSIRGEESTKLLAGDIGFCQGPEYRAQFGGRCAIVKLPRPMIERRAPWLLDRAQGKLAPAVRFANHVRLHMLELTNGTPPLGESQTTMLADSLCNLIALAAADGIPATRLQPELQLEALLAFCRQNLSDPDLSPQQAADHVGILLGTLHSRFRQTGRTFGHWVLENRLEGCSVALRDPHQRHQNISEVAYRWGFNDLSYFSKAFRAQFDMTPGEWRQGLTPS